MIEQLLAVEAEGGHSPPHASCNDMKKLHQSSKEQFISRYDSADCQQSGIIRISKHVSLASIISYCFQCVMKFYAVVTEEATEVHETRCVNVLTREFVDIKPTGKRKINEN